MKFAAFFAAIFFITGTAFASQRTSLTLIAVVQPSATIEISDSAGPASELDFSGAPGSTLAANQGTVTVTAAVSSLPGNTDTIIQVKCTDLLGKTVGDSIPAADISYTNTQNTGGATWFSGNFSNSWTTIAKLTPGSGVYTGDQTFTLNVPSDASGDTYIGTVSYQVVAF